MPGPYCYAYPRPSVTVDVVVFTLLRGKLRVLLIRRKKDPFAGRWAIPGGFLDMDESVEAAVLRELHEETGVERLDLLASLGVYADPNRDPRGRTISLAHAGIVRKVGAKVQGGDDAAEAEWQDPSEVGGLAFDHDLIMDEAIDWLEMGISLGPVGLALLPKSFSDDDVIGLHGQIGVSERKAIAWRKRMERTGRIEPVGGKSTKFRAVAE